MGSVSKKSKKYFYQRHQALNLIKKWHSQKLTIGFTSGAFDLLHYGHIQYLIKASQLCDRLVVGVNTDRSVRRYKDFKRPIVGEKDRVRIIATLEAVSCAFLFDELNNEENILALKPHYYIKGGDYHRKAMTSAKHLIKWNGEAVTIPFLPKHSSSLIIEKILERYHHDLPRIVPLSLAHKSKRRSQLSSQPALFLDRDGVINREIEYLHEPKKFILNRGVITGLKQFMNMDYRLIVVTNQAGIGLGYFTQEDFYRVNKKMLSLFNRHKIIIDKVYYCPHSLSDRCACRKPGTLLLERAIHENNISLEHSIMIGDKTSDILCGQSLGLKTILTTTGHAGQDREYSVKPDLIVKDLIQAAQWVRQFFWSPKNPKKANGH